MTVPLVKRIAVNHRPRFMTSTRGAEPSIRAERADKARNRTKIVAAAMEAFSETGLETSMDAVAARAGVGVGTLYRHFATKHALMVAMVERKFEQIIEVTQAAVDDPQGEPFEVFADVLREGAAVAAADAAAQDALMRAGDAVWEGAAETLAELTEVTRVLMQRAYDAGTLRTDIRPEDISMVMCGVSATMSSRQWDWRRYLDLILDGMRTRP